MEKFKSRKFWVMVGAVGSLIVAEFTGVTVEPEAIAGLGIILSSWFISQGIVDKAKVTEETRVAGDITKANAIMYARNLEQQLERITAETALSVVPDIEE